jgi:hypothetical protein
MDWIPFTD